MGDFYRFFYDDARHTASFIESPDLARQPPRAHPDRQHPLSRGPNLSSRTWYEGRVMTICDDQTTPKSRARSTDRWCMFLTGHVTDDTLFDSDTKLFSRGLSPAPRRKGASYGFAWLDLAAPASPCSYRRARALEAARTPRPAKLLVTRPRATSSIRRGERRLRRPGTFEFSSASRCSRIDWRASICVASA